jgi:hypothetical protein
LASRLFPPSAPKHTHNPLIIQRVFFVVSLKTPHFRGGTHWWYTSRVHNASLLATNVQEAVTMSTTRSPSYLLQTPHTGCFYFRMRVPLLSMQFSTPETGFHPLGSGWKFPNTRHWNIYCGQPQSYNRFPNPSLRSDKLHVQRLLSSLAFSFFHDISESP